MTTDDAGHNMLTGCFLCLRRSSWCVVQFHGTFDSLLVMQIVRQQHDGSVTRGCDDDTTGSSVPRSDMRQRDCGNTTRAAMTTRWPDTTGDGVTDGSATATTGHKAATMMRSAVACRGTTGSSARRHEKQHDEQQRTVVRQAAQRAAVSFTIRFHWYALIQTTHHEQTRPLFFID